MDDFLGRCPRLLWVVSRATCRLVCYYWLIICLFPRASAAASGGVWGSAPRRFCFLNLRFVLFQNVSSSWLQCINDVSSSAFCYPRKVPIFLTSTPSRNLTIRVMEEERAAQSKNRVYCPAWGPSLRRSKAFSLLNQN